MTVHICICINIQPNLCQLMPPPPLLTTVSRLNALKIHKLNPKISKKLTKYCLIMYIAKMLLGGSKTKVNNRIFKFRKREKLGFAAKRKNHFAKISRKKEIFN